MDKTTLIETLERVHRQQYGSNPEVIAYAPGRIEVLGNHTDYNGGTVLSTAIDLGHSFAVSPNDNHGLRLTAGDLKEMVSFDLSDMEPVPGTPWANFVKGVFYFLQERGIEIGNWDCTFLGNIPIGSGLSSSAALEVSAARAALKMAGEKLDKLEIAKVCQRSENTFAGCQCGLLDQISSLYGEEHALIHSDFQSLKVKTLTLPDEILFLLVTPTSTHVLAQSPYNERRESCEKALEEFQALIPRKLTHLRDVTPEEFAMLSPKISAVPAQRAAHIIGEIDRVHRGAMAINKRDKRELGELLYQSHQSSIENFDNSCAELDQVVQVCRQSGALGARLSGGGWGGSIVVLAEEDQAASLEEKISSECERLGREVKMRRVHPSDGAEVLRPE